MQLQSPHLMLGNVLTCSMFYKGSAHRRCVCVMSICLVGLCLSSFHLYVFIACLYEPQIGRLLNLVELVTIKILFIKQHSQTSSCWFIRYQRLWAGWALVQLHTEQSLH